MKKFCESLREHAINIIDFEKNVVVNKKRIQITSRRNRMLHLQKKFIKKFSKDKNHRKVRDHCHYRGEYRDAAHSICNFRFNAAHEIPAVFHNN